MAIEGTSAAATVTKLVDGDTIHVDLGGDTQKLRILALDTEESSASSGKPETPFGHQAKAEAANFFSVGDDITMEFPGTEPLEEALVRYRGNFGRLLVYVHKNGQDFTEHMIGSGFSPLFNKYGNAQFHQDVYVAAERHAQATVERSVWNQVVVNGSEMRNYAALGAWWGLRASIIDDYRARKAAGAQILNSRLDFEAIKAAAANGDDATVFTELREHFQVGGGSHTVIRIGSQQQPFQLFLPNTDDPAGQEILRLLDNRYMSTGDDHPRRSYAYVTGTLVLFPAGTGDPEIVITDAGQITDQPPN